VFFHCALLTAAACGPRLEKGAFPDDFLFGAAMAGFQVDAGCPTMAAEQCEDRASDWYQWVTDEDLLADSTTYLSGEPLSNGPGHWELYAEDFERAAEELNLDAVRVSIEFSRLFPDDPGEVSTVDALAATVSTDAVAAYHAYFDAILDNDLTVMATLNHYTLPLWLHNGKDCHFDMENCEDRGWADPDRTIEMLGLYAGFAAREFGEDIGLWLTLNEPFAVILSGYLQPGSERSNPPGVSDPTLAISLIETMIEAHAAMYDAVHAEDSDAQVGAAPNLVVATPNDSTSTLDQTGAEHLDYVYNRAFLNGIVYGEIDLNLDGEADEVRDHLVGRSDFIGVNYYTRLLVDGLTISLVSGYDWLDFLPAGSLWDEYPEGIAEVIAIGTSYGLPVYITENGTSDHDGAVDRFLVPHLNALHGAILEGHDVRGYFAWTLFDNYEWNHGMDMKFGLYAVDIETKQRSIREIGAAYAEIAKDRRLPQTD
jgi:beta-glucosidase/6-phospho-beta-glucosidase/beta-galactosidase